jgi:hypothetical protein
MPTGTVSTQELVKRPLSPADIERHLRDIRSHEPVKWTQVPPRDRMRAREAADLSIEELCAVLSAGGRKVSVKQLTSWEETARPTDDDGTTNLYRRFLCATAIADALRSINRWVLPARLLKAVGSETGNKAPRTKAKPAGGNLSEQVAVAEREGDV